MAVGTVSGVDPSDNWQLIATNSPSVASTTSFTSISGYKTLMITYKLTTSAAGSGTLNARFNSDSTSGNYGGNVWMQTTFSNRADDRLPLTAYLDSPLTGYFVLNNTDKTMPKIISEAGSVSSILVAGIYYGTSAISAIEIYPSTGTISGSISLYGIAA